MKRIMVMSLLALTLAALFLLPVSASQGTEGTELQVLTAEQLEIYLGAELAGAEFSLKTDAGIYPGTVVADEHGLLKLEIGGSSAYVLTRLHTQSDVPTQTEAIEEPEPSEAVEAAEPVASEEEEIVTTEAVAVPEPTDAAKVEAEPSQADNSIPTLHIVLFAGGAALCIGFLLVSFFLKRRRERSYDAEDDI